MSREQRLEELLTHLVADLNDYNQHDMLGGYLNALGTEHNDDLASLDLPTIEKVETDED